MVDKECTGSVCAYCGNPNAAEDDHVVARQFFPNEERFRANLPKVPCCPDCNRAKQRAEDVAGVFLPFRDGSEGSQLVVSDRVPRTLAKNKRLAREFREGVSDVWAQESSGLYVKRYQIELSDRSEGDINALFSFVFRGLYRFETGNVLPLDHEVHLIVVSDHEHLSRIVGAIRRDPNHGERSFANGELRYIFAVGEEDPVSCWLLIFMSLAIAAVSIGPGCPILARDAILRSAWQPR